ncbi:hypothetical protein JCM9279_001098 [Rhodotorula babjevae]
MQTASDLICRLRDLEADRQRIELSQALLQGEVRAFSHEVARAAQNDPAILSLLQAEARSLLPHVAPLAQPDQFVLESGDFIIGTFDEDVVPSSGVPYLALSPPFGATDLDFPARTFPALVDIPDLPLPAAAMPFSMTAHDDAWGAHVPPSLVSTLAPSNFSSSPPSSFCSPIFSPMNVAASSFGADRTSSHGSSGSPLATSSMGSLALLPPAFQPAPSDEHLEAFLAGSSTLERMPSQSGKVKCGSHAGDTRFDPLGSSTRVRRGLSVCSSSTSPDIPVSPELKPASTKTGTFSSRTRSVRRAVKGPTSSVAVEKNDEHMFAVLVPGNRKVDETSLTRLYLDHSHLDPTSPLGCTVTGDTAYTASSFARDCERASVYSFFTASRAQWVVTFSLLGPAIVPVTSSSSDSTTAATTATTTTTFLHFLPGDLVVSPSLPLGSREWWRLQECRGMHAGYLNGAWTARYDDEAAATSGGAGGGGGAEKRRPARILGHFAKCCPVDDADGEWSLMKLARLMKK